MSVSLSTGDKQFACPLGNKHFYTQGGTNIFNIQEGVDIFHLHMVGYQVAKNLLGLVSWIILVSKGEG